MTKINDTLAQILDEAPDSKAGRCAVATGSVSRERTAAELTHLLFPTCSRYCATVEYLGCGECEAVCPQKFNPDGTAKTQNNPTQPTAPLTQPKREAS